MQLIHGGSNSDTDLGRLFEISPTTKPQDDDTATIVDKLYAREYKGDQPIMIMFFTGPAGAEKSSTTTVKWLSVYDIFCLIVTVIWTHNIFFTKSYT